MKILIVEDEKLLADSLRAMLEGKGFTVEAVYDGETGAEYAELTRVSLTFCGGFSPEAIAARLQGLFPAGAVVSVTVDISAAEA